MPLQVTPVNRNLQTRVTFMLLEFEDLFIVLGAAAVMNVLGHFVGGEIAGMPTNLVLQYGVPLLMVPVLMAKGFVRIRHFGFLANRRRAALLPRCFAALHATPPKNESETSPPPTTHPLWRCPKCGGPMAVVERFTAAQLQLRSPPLLAAAA